MKRNALVITLRKLYACNDYLAPQFRFSLNAFVVASYLENKYKLINTVRQTGGIKKYTKDERINFLTDFTPQMNFHAPKCCVSLDNFE